MEYELIHQLRQIVEAKFFFGTNFYEPGVFNSIVQEKLCDTVHLALLHCASQKPYPEKEWNVWHLLHSTATLEHPHHHLFTRAVREHIWQHQSDTSTAVSYSPKPTASSPLRVWLELAYVNHCLAVTLWHTVLGKFFDEPLLATTYNSDAFVLREKCRYLLFLVLLAIDNNQPEVYYHLHSIMFLSSKAALHEAISFGEEATESMLAGERKTLETPSGLDPSAVMDEALPPSRRPPLEADVDLEPSGEQPSTSTCFTHFPDLSLVPSMPMARAITTDSGRETSFASPLSVSTATDGAGSLQEWGDYVPGMMKMSPEGQQFHSAAFLLEDPPLSSTASATDNPSQSGPSPPTMENNQNAAAFQQRHRRIQSDHTLELRRSITLEVAQRVRTEEETESGLTHSAHHPGHQRDSGPPLRHEPELLFIDGEDMISSDGAESDVLPPLEFHNTLGREMAHFEMAEYLITCLEAVACDRELPSITAGEPLMQTDTASVILSPQAKRRVAGGVSRQVSNPLVAQLRDAAAGNSIRTASPLLSPAVSIGHLTERLCTSPDSLLSQGPRILPSLHAYPLNPGDPETVAVSVIWPLDLSQREVLNHVHPQVLRDLYALRDMPGAPHLPTMEDRERWIEMRREETRKRLLRQEKVASSITKGSASAAASLLASYPSPPDSSWATKMAATNLLRREFLPGSARSLRMVNHLHGRSESLSSWSSLSTLPINENETPGATSPIPIGSQRPAATCTSPSPQMNSLQSTGTVTSSVHSMKIRGNTLPTASMNVSLAQQKLFTVFGQDWATKIHTKVFDKTERAAVWKKQENRCPGCGVEIADAFVKRLRFCEYYGMYFCTVCHTNRLMLVPGHILHSWNFTMMPVSVLASEMLERIHMSHYIFNVMLFNPDLITKVNALRNLEVLRTQAGLLKPFLEVCCRAVTEKRELLQLPPHWCENYTYTMADFELIKAGVFVERLTAVLNAGMRHVRHCELCQGRGHVCEVCHSPEVLFPFQLALVQSAAANVRSKGPLLSAVVQCADCGACYHRKCAASSGVVENCPKCARRRQHSQQLLSATGETTNNSTTTSNNNKTTGKS